MHKLCDLSRNSRHSLLCHVILAIVTVLPLDTIVLPAYHTTHTHEKHLQRTLKCYFLLQSGGVTMLE